MQDVLSDDQLHDWWAERDRVEHQKPIFTAPSRRHAEHLLLGEAIWKPAFGTTYCGPCANEGYYCMKYVRKVLVPQVAEPRVTEQAVLSPRRPGIVLEQREEKLVRSAYAKSPHGSWQSVVFAYLDLHPTAQASAIAAATGCKENSASAYRSMWRHRND